MSIKPSLIFTSDAGITFSNKPCSSWNGSITKTQTCPVNTFLTGIKMSAYDDYNAEQNCLGRRFGSINQFFNRSIINPNEILTDQTSLDPVWGYQFAPPRKKDKLSAGDILDDNIFTDNIFSPNTINKYYGYNGVEFYAGSSTPYVCVIYPECQPVEIRFKMINIYNPRDIVVQVVNDGRSVEFKTLVKMNSFTLNPRDVLTSTTWIYSTVREINVNVSQGLGSITAAQGKTIGIQGITDSNIGSIKKDWVTKILYDQGCTNWTVKYYYIDSSGNPTDTTSELVTQLVTLREKYRTADDILPSDYYEGFGTSKIYRYFEVLNSNGFKIGELYGVIDLTDLYLPSSSASAIPKIKTWFSFYNGRNIVDPLVLRTVKTGYNSNVLVEKEFVNTSDYYPDMPIEWGILSDLQIQMLKTNHGINLNFRDISRLDSNASGNSFVVVGTAPDNNTRKSLILFMPNTGCNIRNCDVGIDCNLFNKKICLNGRCVECTASNECASNQTCHNNICKNNIPCTSNLSCDTDEIFKVCNTSLNRCVQCNSRSDCPEGLLCSVLDDNICVNCKDNTCPTGEKCVDGKCQTTTPTTPTSGSFIYIGLAVIIIIILGLFFLKFLKKKVS